MEKLACPPFCEMDCGLVHDKLLLALVNCPEGEIPDSHQDMLMTAIKEKKEDKDWSTHDPLDDANPDYQYPAVLWACAIGKPVLVQWLLSNGFEQGIQDKETGDNGLHRSILCLQRSLTGWKEAVYKFKELLPLMGDCLVMKSSSGETPFHVACEMWVRKENSPEFYRGCTLAIFEYAQSRGQEFMSKMLNSQREDGQTVIHILAHTDAANRVLKSFVTQGKPDLFIKDKQGMTALGVAVSLGQMTASQLLSKNLNKESSADNTMDQSGTEKSEEHSDNTENRLIQDYVKPVSSESVQVKNCTQKLSAEITETEPSDLKKSPRKAIKRENSKEQSGDITETDDYKTSPRKGIKRKSTKDLSKETEITKETMQSSEVVKTISDEDFGSISKKRKRGKTGLDNAKSDNVQTAIANNTNEITKLVKESSTLHMDSKRILSPRSGSTSTGKKKKKGVNGEPDACPLLSPISNEPQINGNGQSPPILVAECPKNILEEAESVAKKGRSKSSEAIKNKGIWSRYIHFCGKKLPEAMPILLTMTAAQLQDVFAVYPEIREKLGDHLEMLSTEERIQIPVVVQDLIAQDPLEETLKDLIAKEVKENEEREIRIKKDFMELAAFEDRMKSPADSETESPSKNLSIKESRKGVLEVYDIVRESESCGVNPIPACADADNRETTVSRVETENNVSFCENSATDDWKSVPENAINSDVLKQSMAFPFDIDNICKEEKEDVSESMSEASTEIPDSTTEEISEMDDKSVDTDYIPDDDDQVTEEMDFENVELDHNYTSQLTADKDNELLNVGMDDDASTLDSTLDSDVSNNDTTIIHMGGGDTVHEIGDTDEKNSPKSASSIVPKILITDHKEGLSPVKECHRSRSSAENSPGRKRESFGDGLVAYLNLNSSTRTLLRESLRRDREECLEIWRKKQEILNGLDEKSKKLEINNNELEAEINGHMEKVRELKTRLMMNKTSEQELQTEIQSEKAKIEQVKVKLQTCEKALEELDH